jgi:hypothetical protein
MAKGGKRILIPVEDTSFSKAWVDANPWMGEVNKSSKSPVNEMSMFVNFPNGLPTTHLRKEWDRMVAWREDEEERLTIFHNMMKEKGIKPGRNGVGKPHKGWGNSRQKS